VTGLNKIAKLVESYRKETCKKKYILYTWEGRKSVTKAFTSLNLICKFDTALIKISIELF
jgi:hypothetical protein